MNSFDHDSLLTMGSIIVSSIGSVVAPLSVTVTCEVRLGFIGDEDIASMDFAGLDPKPWSEPGVLSS